MGGVQASPSETVMKATLALCRYPERPSLNYNRGMKFIHCQALFEDRIAELVWRETSCCLGAVLIRCFRGSRMKGSCLRCTCFWLQDTQSWTWNWRGSLKVCQLEYRKKETSPVICEFCFSSLCWKAAGSNSTQKDLWEGDIHAWHWCSLVWAKGIQSVGGHWVCSNPLLGHVGSKQTWSRFSKRRLCIQPRVNGF